MQLTIQYCLKSSKNIYIFNTVCIILLADTIKCVSHRQQQHHSSYNPLGRRLFGPEVEGPHIRGPALLRAVYRTLVSTLELLLLCWNGSNVQHWHGGGQIPQNRLSDESRLGVPARSWEDTRHAELELSLVVLTETYSVLTIWKRVSSSSWFIFTTV